MDTWDQSLGATTIELRLIEWMGKKMKYPEGFDGVFTSGGTQSNLMALLIARDAYIKKKKIIISYLISMVFLQKQKIQNILLRKKSL